MQRTLLQGVGKIRLAGRSCFRKSPANVYGTCIPYSARGAFFDPAPIGSGHLMASRDHFGNVYGTCISYSTRSAFFDRRARSASAGDNARVRGLREGVDGFRQNSASTLRANQGAWRNGKAKARRPRVSEVTFAHVGLTPECDLKDHRLPPGVVHAIDDVSRVVAPLEVRLHRGDDGGAEGDEVAGTDVAESVTVVGLALLAPVVSQADLVLIVEPRLVVIRLRRVEDPLTKRKPTALA